MTGIWGSCRLLVMGSWHKPRLHASAIFHHFVAVVVVRTIPLEIPLAMINTNIAIHGFSFLPYISMVLRLGTLRAVGLPLKLLA